MRHDLARLIREVPDYPQPGVMFRDITPLLASPGGFAASIDALVGLSPTDVDVVIGIEARGFLFGAPVALALGAGFVPIRKPAKLPRGVVTVTYDLEYGTETLALHEDAFVPGTRVLVVDDVLATGGTMVAAAELVARLGGELIGVSLLSELTYLGGRERLAAAGIGPVASVVSFDALMSFLRGSGSGSGPRVRSRQSWSHQTLVSLPARSSTPAGELSRRGLLALSLLVFIVALVYFDRGAYTDSFDGSVSLIDAIYYATVTITTTGYGDITPVTPTARILNAVLVTPMRILFLVLLVGTTLEVLANEGRRILRDNRWRKHMRNHVVVVGYGTKGRSAVETLQNNGSNPAQVVVIDPKPGAVVDANLRGFAAIEGDATRRDVLRRAEISKAREVIITLDRDDSAILVTLTVRQLNPSAHVVVAVREDDNASLVRQSGANAVVTSSEAVGRLLGLSAVSPNLGTVIEDLLSSHEGLEVGERQVRRDEVGKAPDDIKGEAVIAVIRNKTLRRFYDPTVAKLETGDQVVVVRHSETEVAEGERSAQDARRRPSRRDDW